MATKVDIDIVPRAHAILSASSAERWLTCTPSARIEEALPDRGSSYANDGTAAHAFSELRLRFLLGKITKAEYMEAYEANKVLHAEFVNEWVVSDWEAIDSYVSYVLAEAAQLDAKVYIEQKVDYSKYAQGGFGTSDVVLVSKTNRIIKAIDLKWGKGVPVSAMDNPQAKLYTLGALLAFDPDATGLFDHVEWAIHQPRLEYVGEDECSTTELLDWAENTVAPAAKKAWLGEGELHPTDKGCRFCKVAATCRARVAENILIARRDFMTDPDPKAIDPRLEDRLMTAKEVAALLPLIDNWINWANKFKDYALTQARDKAVEIPGYKLVRGRSNRDWKPGVDVLEALKKAGVSETQMMKPATLLSPTQVEKNIGKTPFAVMLMAAPLVEKPLGTPTLVPESDPRPSIDAVQDARKEFDLG